MPFMDGFKLEPLPRNWHDETVAWRETYFPEMPEASGGSGGGGGGPPPATSDLSSRVWRAEELDDNRFNTALKIIRAQASTELWSIQQHRMVYEKLDSGSLTGLDKEIV